MAEYLLSNLADQDISDIYQYTVSEFGESKANAYLTGIDEKLTLLAEQPRLGRSIDFVREGYFRSEYASHSIFYTLVEEGILVVRVLHNRMDSTLHL